MSKRIHVLHIFAQMNVGGVECWMMEVLRRIDRERFRFTFCTLREGKGVFDDEIRELGGSVVSCPVRSPGSPFAKRFGPLLGDLGVNAIHSHVLFFSGQVLKVATTTGVPIRIAHAHTTGDGYRDTIGRRCYRWLMRRSLHRCCTHGLGCSTPASDFLFGQEWASKFVRSTVPCAIEPEKYGQPGSRSDLLSGLDVPTDAMVVGHVGSFRAAKNHKFLLQVFREMVTLEPRSHLVLVGDGPLRAPTDALARELGIANKVSFAGIRDDVPSLMSSAFDFFLFPSAYEGLGIVLIEAQCAGLPCMASTAVSEEAVVVDDLVVRESLETPAATWARRAVDLAGSRSVDKETARKLVTDSRFNILSSVDFLSSLYRGEVRSLGIAEE